MSVCCICGIDYTPKSSGITFHKIPKNMEKRNRWLTKIERKICNFSYTATSVICSQHFEKECYTMSSTGKFMLKSYAVPTIFNMPLKAKYNVHDTDEEIKLQNTYNKSITKETSKIYHHKGCTESSCKKSIPGTSTHRKYSVHDTKIQPQNTCIVKEAFKTYCDEECAESLCKESITGISTQGTKITGHLPKRQSILKIHRMTKFGTSQSVIVKNMECNELQHAQETIKQLKRKLKMYQQKCRRYKKKIDSLTLFTKHLQDRRLLSRDAAEFLEEFPTVGRDRCEQNGARNKVLVEVKQHDEL